MCLIKVYGQVDWKAEVKGMFCSLHPFPLKKREGCVSPRFQANPGELDQASPGIKGQCLVCPPLLSALASHLLTPSHHSPSCSGHTPVSHPISRVTSHGWEALLRPVCSPPPGLCPHFMVPALAEVACRKRLHLSSLAQPPGIDCS